MTLKGLIRPFGCLMIGAVFALLGACSTSDGASSATPAPSSASSLSSPSPTVTSTSSPSTMSSSVTETNPTVSTGTSPWPADLTPDQVSAAQAAIAAYVGYYQLVDQAYMHPGKDWTSEVSKWATDPEKSSFLRNMAGTAQLGQYGTGSTVVYPRVTKVEPGVVTMTVCVDSTAAGFFDKAGQSIKAPDAPGSYFRHVSEVQVALYQGGVWLVTFVTDDYNTTC